MRWLRVNRNNSCDLKQRRDATLFISATACSETYISSKRGLGGQEHRTKPSTAKRHRLFNHETSHRKTCVTSPTHNHHLLFPHVNVSRWLANLGHTRTHPHALFIPFHSSRCTPQKACTWYLPVVAEPGRSSLIVCITPPTILSLRASSQSPIIRSRHVGIHSEVDYTAIVPSAFSHPTSFSS